MLPPRRRRHPGRFFGAIDWWGIDGSVVTGDVRPRFIGFTQDPHSH
ncbi:hypothetical protein [Streptomyces sp. MMG1533]|nr:hypothetical protein [Streptomyces sp. MMG1533]